VILASLAAAAAAFIAFDLELDLGGEDQVLILNRAGVGTFVADGKVKFQV